MQTPLSFSRLPASTRLRVCALLILLLGMGTAAVLYATSPGDDEAAPGDGSSYFMEGGTSYTLAPSDSRSYRRSLEYFGGKSAVEMTELREWFAGLWHGTPLAIIIACLTLLASGGCLYLAESLAEEPQSPDKVEEKPTSLDS
jgi:hypothetical protein